MEKVIIEKIDIEGFCSVQKPLRFDLNRNGLFLIKGANGAGKTTIFSAVLWALYKLNLKGVADEDIATDVQSRTEAFRGTRVVIVLSVGDDRYMIARHLNFKGSTLGLSAGSKLMIFKKGFEDKEWLMQEEQHKKDQQVLIESIIGIDSKTFLNSVLFGQRMKRIIEADNDEKRAIFDKLFDVGFINLCKENATQFVEKVSKSISDLKHQIDKNEVQIKYKEQEVINTEEVLKHFETGRKQRIEAAEDELKEAKLLVEIFTRELSESKEKYDAVIVPNADDLRAQIGQQKEVHSKALTAMSEVSYKFKEALKNLHTSENLLKEVVVLERDFVDNFDKKPKNCSTCGSPLNAEKLALQRKSELDTLHEARLKHGEDIKNFHAQVQDLGDEKEKLTAENNLQAEKLKELMDNDIFLQIQKAVAEQNELKLQGSVKKGKLDASNSKIVSLQKTIEKIKAEQPPNVSIESLKALILELQDSKQKAGVEIEQLSAKLQKAEWWLKKGYNSGGIKAFVFNAMLTRLNVFIEKYCSRFGVSVVLGVDMTKSSKPFTTTCYKDGKIFNYKSLSGGEKQRIDIAMSFAMHDLVSETAPVNILVMDEVMEGLDSEGVETAFDLVRQKLSSGRSIYMITHHELVDAAQSKNIQILKDEDGSTRVLE